MNKRFFSMLLLACASIMAFAQIERPKLVVGIIIDQMRWDALYYYYDQYGDGGFKRLLNDGFSCENHMINYIPTITAVGHASVYTGTSPAFHGIAGNDFTLDGKMVYCCNDKTVKGVGTESKAGQMSPRNMLGTTIGDQIRMASDFKARVYGVALKDRASILPAGHSANAAFWYDSSVGHFITSTYYMDKLPEWMVKFNKENKTKPGVDMKMKPEGATLTFKMAEAVLKNENLGRNTETDLPDMLCVSISSTDAMGHTYGTRGEEMKSVYMATDEGLAHFFNTLDEQVGRGNYLVFLTADHAGAHNPNFLRRNKVAAGGTDVDGVRKRVNGQLAEKFNVQGNLVSAIYDQRVYLDHALIEANHLELATVKKEAIKRLQEEKDFVYVVDFDAVETASIPKLIKERIINGYRPGRSGDICAILRPDYLGYTFDENYRGTTHGAWNPYDAHIPLLFMGWHVEHGSTTLPTRTVDTAPTVCAMLHVQMPNACMGDAISVVADQKR